MLLVATSKRTYRWAEVGIIAGVNGLVEEGERLRERCHNRQIQYEVTKMTALRATQDVWRRRIRRFGRGGSE